MSDAQVANIAAYKFVPLADPQAWKRVLLTELERIGGEATLRGTVLLAEEGINLFLSGPEPTLQGFLGWLRGHREFADLEAKWSLSGAVPFRYLLVKVKREIIRMNHTHINPSAGRAPSVDAETLDRWLSQGHDDAGREVVLLDTRNDFEFDEGSFESAIDFRIPSFTHFPGKVRDARSTLADKTVVTFCTGGIRCEKAALYMQEIGYPAVFQLEGGILKYFEHKGGRHYRGRCFVFDERRAVNPDLTPAS